VTVAVIGLGFWRRFERSKVHGHTADDAAP
jgi:hypothetical protein